MLADQNCNLSADRGDNTAVALEIADPVENDSYTVGARKISVSNFVTPAWFDPSAAEDAKFDHLGKVTKPFQMTKGGYVALLQEGRVKQVFGEEDLGDLLVVDPGRSPATAGPSWPPPHPRRRGQAGRARCRRSCG